MPTDSASSSITSEDVTYTAPSETSATRPSELSQGEAEMIGERWGKVLDEQLIEWASHPEDFIDEGLVPPSRKTIHLAYEHVLKPFRDNGRVPPSHVVPDANGGIVFELRNNDVFESIRVQADGHVEYCRFCGGRLVVRQRWR